jgi:hypothetical protein
MIAVSRWLVEKAETIEIRRAERKFLIAVFMARDGGSPCNRQAKEPGLQWKTHTSWL